MREIALLDDSMINKIAAGEVVERPVSVVKELVENSIDAGSTSIVVEIKEGGLSEIRITDNGAGIEENQLELAFVRHSTSKIRDVNDLENVLTMGFRGEALSSISGVSHVELISKTNKSIHGARIIVNGGIIVEKEQIGCVDGSTFIVRDLFFNVPARRKFLKSAKTESGYISDMVDRLALANPNISFKYINNNSVILQTSGNNDLKTAILNVYGGDVAKKLIEIDYKSSIIKISGYIGKPELSRGNRSYENIFINGRYIKSDIVKNAVEEAYKTRLPIGKFPLFILNIEINPVDIDINVHPTKLEVRFSDEDLIYKEVYNAVLKSFNGENLIPSISLETIKPKEKFPVENPMFTTQKLDFGQRLTLREDMKNTENTNVGSPFSAADILYGDVKLQQDKQQLNLTSDIVTNAENHITQKHLENIVSKGLMQDFTPNLESEPEYIQIKKQKKNNIFNNYNIVGQIFNTYWAVQQGDSMYLIDQHAAHERILYETFINQVNNEKANCQILLEPMAVKLNQSEINIVEENTELLKKFGFSIILLGPMLYAINGVPYIFNKPANADYFLEIIDKLSSFKCDNDSIYKDKLDIIASVSCKAAVKANDKLNYIEAKAIIEEIMELENPFTCPHGRPTIIEFSKYEIEKMFKRV